ncbi:lipopolysaccharide biosynthesis protein [Fibrella sp. HMF5335]|uniref:Lipopolysaccharide biosynthesis protein n=1 Tax=Fibrella rubiginis TaxID=2817060 RepID=A0A939K3M4_9BACT|nr:lipopolysaccharide biosynthesis protein [Fibrella rubiginis]MBO0939412.1 lipopolysaccharide biosynthesis protein [Fibrella rubiginis]
MGLIQKQTLQGTVVTYVGIIIGLLTTGFLLPNLLFKDQIGLIQLLGSLSIILTQFANLGINGAGGRFFPYFRDYERGHSGFLLVAVSVAGIGFLGCAGLLWVAHDWLVAQNNDRSGLFERYFYLLLPLTLFTLFFNLFDTYARLLYDSVTGTFLRDVGQRVFFLAAVVAYYLGYIGFYGLLCGWLGSYLLAMLLMIGSIARQGHFTLNPVNLAISPDLRRSMARYAGLTLLTGLSTQLILHIDKLLVFKATNLDNTGIYGISANFGAVIVAPALILYKVSGIVIADSWKNNDLANIQLVYEKSCLSQLIIGALVFVGIAANLPGVFTFLPKGYEAGYNVILWVGLSKLFDMATGVNGQIITTSKHYAWDSLFNLIMVVLTIVITPVLLRIYGLEGAAIGAAITIGLFNLSRTLFVWYRFGLQPFTWRNLAVIGIALLVWGLAVLPPYATGTKLATLADMAIRSAGIVALYMGLVFAFRIYPDLNLMVGKYRN